MQFAKTSNWILPTDMTPPAEKKQLETEGEDGILPDISRTQSLELVTQESKDLRGDVKDEKPGYLEDLEFENHDIEWMSQFTCIKILLIIFGRWPITYSQESSQRGYVFKFSWSCPGSIIFCCTAVFTIYGLVMSSINIIDILMRDKVMPAHKRRKSEIIEQGLAERHTMILLIMLGSYGVNAWTLFFIFLKRHQTSETLTKWTRFLHSSKLNGSTRTYTYVGIVVANYILFFAAYIVLTVFRTSATFMGGPTVVSIVLVRNFMPNNYLENFTGSIRHKIMHVVGCVIYFYVVIGCNVYMYLFLWLLKSMESAFASWNIRMVAVVEPKPESKSEQKPGTQPPSTVAVEESAKAAEEETKAQINPPNHPKLNYQALYHDHIGLVRMLSWFNNMFAYTLEPYVLFFTIKFVYQIYLAALVVKSNGKPLNNINVGRYFIRKRDYIPPVLLTYENAFMIITMLLASSWLEDTSYESYDVLRKISLLKGTTTDKESFFYLSMFQSYTSTTKMSVYGGQYFGVDRYTILHVLSAVMSNFLVVYQFAPLFDMDTVGEKDDDEKGLRYIMGKFLESFEGLPVNHTLPVDDNIRNKEGF